VNAAASSVRYFPLGVRGRDMSQYTVTGRFSARDGWQAFEKTIDAENEDVAVEHVYANFGAEHGLKRTQVTIEEVGQ
jgi:large subunit ribosomal protein LX